jgi:hypothetical protein
MRDNGIRTNLAMTPSTRSLLRCILLPPALLCCLAVGAATEHGSGTLCRGTRWETTYYTQKSDRPGPTVLIIGGIHGDEPAGAAAADQIRHWPITTGALLVLPRANVPGLTARTRLMPDVAKDQANLNRNFPKAGKPGPPVGQAAEAIWGWVRSARPDWLIDLHEGSGIRAAGSASVGSSLIVFGSPDADRMAAHMLDAVNTTITDPRKKFVRLSPPVDGSLARAAGQHLNARAMIAETSINDLPSSKGKATGKKPAASAARQPLSRRVRQHRLMVCRLLKELGMLDAAFDPDRMAGSSTPAPRR